ncbi:MAG TPA: hypothetical protein VHO06_12830 [Polyangia bacterium]|nr:hypothetical protein [Polyangia bacterium]
MSISGRLRLRWALVAAIGLGGCAETTVTYTPLNAPPHGLTARAPEQVSLFSSAAPERPHVDVGLISIEEGEIEETPENLIATLRQSAAERGCDALLLAPPSGTTRPTGLVVLGTGPYRNGVFQVYSATCIVYQTTESAVPPSSMVADRHGPPRGFPDGRRICRDRRDFDETRNCVLRATLH